jgi:hypothetical protein
LTGWLHGEEFALFRAGTKADFSGMNPLEMTNSMGADLPSLARESHKHAQIVDKYGAAGGLLPLTMTANVKSNKEP